MWLGCNNYIYIKVRVTLEIIHYEKIYSLDRNCLIYNKNYMLKSRKLNNWDLKIAKYSFSRTSNIILSG